LQVRGRASDGEKASSALFSRYHVAPQRAKSGLKEVPIKEATMHRRLVVIYRDNSYLSLAASRLIELFSAIRDMG
jgi:DNA-binding transcriptional LysR family regulator